VEGDTVPADTTAKITELVVLATTLLASLTEKTTFAAVYAAPGVPVTAPVLVLRLKPAGSVPDVMLKVYGVAPPLGVKGEKLVIAVPSVRLCAAVVAVAVMETFLLLGPTLPPPHATTSRLRTTTLERFALKTASLCSARNTLAMFRKIILQLSLSS
jgi:hypothetical protein